MHDTEFFLKYFIPLDIKFKLQWSSLTCFLTAEVWLGKLHAGVDVCDILRCNVGWYVQGQNKPWRIQTNQGTVISDEYGKFNVCCRSCWWFLSCSRSHLSQESGGITLSGLPNAATESCQIMPPCPKMIESRISNCSRTDRSSSHGAGEQALRSSQLLACNIAAGTFRYV